MKHFQLAIASIVDANTGHGFSRGNSIDYREADLRSRALRSNSAHALFDAIGRLFRDAVAAYRERSRQRRAVESLSQLSDHYLEDIGLTRQARSDLPRGTQRRSPFAPGSGSAGTGRQRRGRYRHSQVQRRQRG